MTNEEWETADSAQDMLMMLRETQPRFLRKQVRNLHGFLIACCWKHEHLIPQDGLRNGLKGAEKWLSGEIDNAELDRLNYYSEAEAFIIDYAKTPDELEGIEELIKGIEEVREMPFEQARALLLKAAYFAEGSMTYPRFSKLPWVESLFSSEFLCPILLRKFVRPKFA